MTAFALIRAGGAEPCRPWPRHSLPRSDWAAMVAALAHDATALLGLWADTLQVHALFRDGSDVLVASVAVEAGSYPALSPALPAAALFERMIGDLWGHAAEGGRDGRAWLNHGRWPLAHPLSPRPGLPGGAVEPPEFATMDEAGVMQIPLGPIHGAIEEPAHLRLAARGDEVLRAEARLGYAHKGTLALMRGKSPRTAARFVARLAAEATVAHALAFARATEAALGVAVPPRAAALRAVMTEQERIAGHLDDLGRMADAGGLAPLHAAAGRQRELLLRASDLAFGHRLMMDVVIPGGVAADIAADGTAALRNALDGTAAALPGLRRRMDPLLARLEGVGVIAGADAGGVVGRAAGRAFDARLLDPAYAAPGLAAPLERAGDAAARCRVRLAEIADSVRLLRALLDGLPEGPVSVALPAESGEGLGCAESLRGAVWHWLRLDHGQIAAAFPCDPGWTLWPLAEAAIAGGPAEEVDMIRLSCGLPVSALDL
ncbi:MAG TPA: nickel-dependent hydrogenase large subunit [Acetobacteraceae bacterium]|nr:nickel-dependent hydrogenase large subunit [Acetobacteraceae bacterium]